MKKAIVLFSILLSTQVFAKDTCRTSWDLYMSNIPVGKMNDVISKKGSDIEITSSYIPTGIASIFNVNKVIRLVKFQANQLVLRQEETQSQGKKEIYTWSKNGDYSWEKAINNDIKDSVNLENSNLTIDSTSLPYLIQLGVLGKMHNQQMVNVIAKNKTYEGTVKIEPINDDPVKKLKVFFKTERNNGTIYFNSNGKPVEMFFSDPKLSFTGYIAENSCEKM